MIRCLKQLARKIIILNPTKANYKFVLKDWISLGDLSAMSKVLETKRFSQNLDPVIMNGPEARSVLVLAPHPDDDVISSGGTLMHLIRDGCEVKVIYLTSGSIKTYQDEENNVLSKTAYTLEEESKRVSKELGTSLEFWRFNSYNNRGIKISNEIVRRIKEIFIKLKPEAVFLPFIADDNDDHRHCVQLFYETFKDMKDVDFEVWAFQVYSTVLPNIVVDITDVIDEKIRLINYWESIKKSRDWGHYAKGLNAFNSRFLKTNQPYYAESFFVVPAKEYIELCSIYFKNPDDNIYYYNSNR